MNKSKKIINLGVVAILTSSLLMTNIALAEEASNALSEEITTESSNSAPLQSSSESKLDDDGQMKETESDSATDTSIKGSIEPIDNWMPDKNLQTAVSETLNISVSNITKKDMLSLEYLDATGKGISNITGLEYASNVMNIQLYDNQISDVTPLQNLTSLTFLELGGNQISDISSLAQLTATIYADKQDIILPEVYVHNRKPYSISIESPIKSYNGLVSLSPQNNGTWTGVYNSGKVEWSGGNQVLERGDLSSTWKIQDGNTSFSGIYIQPYILSKAIITAHNSTIYAGDNWNPIDNFDSALDHEGNPLDFSKITVTGTVNTSQPGVYPIVYRYEGLEEKVEVTVVEGKVEFSTPANISFGTHQLARGINYYPSENLQSPITVTDTRGKGNSWQLSAKLKTEFTNDNGKTLPNALVYKENSSEKTITTANSQLIASKTTTKRIDITDVSANWSNNQGLFLKVNAGEAVTGEYTGVIEWTLNDAP